MKRIFCILLVVSLVFGLASCSGAQKEKDPAKSESQQKELSAKELYELGLQKNKALTSAEYESEVSFGEEKIDTITTVRVREGYDGFSYSRSGKDYYAFSSGKAYVKTAEGAFCAPSTARSFAEYIEKYLFPVYGFSPEDFSECRLEENTVNYEITEKEALALFSSILSAESGAFVPEKIVGQAIFNEESILISETFSVLGQGDQSIQIKTKLKEYRNSQIKPALPAEGEEFLELEDIRLPQMIRTARKVLLGLSTVQATVVRSESFSLPAGNFSLHRDINLYQSGAGEDLLYYRSLQSLKQIADREESRFSQKRLQGGTWIANEYNLITAEKLSEESGAATEAAWQEDVSSILPEFSDFATISVEEDSTTIGIRFTLKSSAAERIVQAAAALFPEIGMASVSESCEANGTLLIENEKNLLTAASFVVQASVLCGEEKGSFTGEFSITVDETESITLPDLQIPTPTTPGMESEHGPEC